MKNRPDTPAEFDIEVQMEGELPGADEYARTKIGALDRLTGEPILHARVKLAERGNPAVPHPVIAQANLDVNGQLVRAQVEGFTAREAIDRLAERLRRRMKRIEGHWQAVRGRMPTDDPNEWRRLSEPTDRPSYFPRPPDQRQIIRRKSFTLGSRSVDEAVLEMELLDYDFHLFTEKGTEQASVVYRTESTGYRLAQVQPSVEDLAPFESATTVSPHPAPVITTEQATERLSLLGLAFLFFIDAAEGRAGVLYRRYDGHYGLITPSG